MFRPEEHAKNNDDCYFYYYSTCKKGDSCFFRHCEAALGTEIVCPDWQVGKCFRPSCSYRHMESAKDRSAIPCYWENQPGGCRKPHCVFRHYRKENIEDAISKKENLILPVSTNDWQPEENPNAAFSRNASLISRTTTQVDAEEEPESALLLPPAVEPLVVSFDGESDSESCTSTPVKPPVLERKVQFKNDDECDSEPLLIKTTKNNQESTENLDFGIKTLQQIREEKEEKEEIKQDAIVETEIKASPVTEKKTSPRRRRTKRKIHLASMSDKEGLDFKVKTLEEIRRERFCKSETSETELQENLTDSKENNENRNQRRHIVLRREKNLNSTETENKKNNVTNLLTSSEGIGDSNETVATVEKPWPKQKRTTREIYQPPKAQKHDELHSISPKRKVDKKESLDNICIKTLDEIREERRLKQLQETEHVDYSSNQVSSSSSLNTIDTNSGMEESNSRKHKMETSGTTPLNKKIRLNTSKFSAVQDGNSLTSDYIQHTSTDKEKPITTKRKLLKEETNNLLLNTAISSPTDEKLHKSNKTQSPIAGKKRKLEVPNISENESRSPKIIANNVAKENLSHSLPSNEGEDDFDLLLDEDDEDVDLNVADVKDDDLLLELEEMINS